MGRSLSLAEQLESSSLSSSSVPVPVVLFSSVLLPDVPTTCFPALQTSFRMRRVSSSSRADTVRSRRSTIRSRRSIRCSSSRDDEGLKSGSQSGEKSRGKLLEKA